MVGGWRPIRHWLWTEVPRRHWRHRTWLAWLLWPVSLPYCFGSRLRFLTRNRSAPPVPIIVVGNLTVGGTGKTPLVLWLADLLNRHGWKPGIVTRGYGGSARHWPQRVPPDGDAGALGDEAVLLARRGWMVAAGPDRSAAVALLLEQGCDVIISDDGLQHHALPRSLEILVVDAVARFGNGFCLPAGPLREPVGRIQSVDLCVYVGQPGTRDGDMQLRAVRFVNLLNPTQTREPRDFDGPVHAVAGIGHPSRFFELLRKLGLRITTHPFPDHHAFLASDFAKFGSTEAVVMTEKDAVKCKMLASANFWYLEVEAVLPAEFGSQVLALLHRRSHE